MFLGPRLCGYWSSNARVGPGWPWLRLRHRARRVNASVCAVASVLVCFHACAHEGSKWTLSQTLARGGVHDMQYPRGSAQVIVDCWLDSPTWDLRQRTGRPPGGKLQVRRSSCADFEKVAVSDSAAIITREVVFAPSPLDAAYTTRNASRLYPVSSTSGVLSVALSCCVYLVFNQ